MFISRLLIEGADYPARAAARRLRLGRECYALKGEAIEFGPKKGLPRRTSVLRVPLSEQIDYERHLRQVEARLGQLMTFLAAERRRHGDGLRMDLSMGMTVGGEKYFIRSVCASPGFLGILVALGIHLSISAYPCSDRTERRRLKWSEGIGRMPGLGR